MMIKALQKELENINVGLVSIFLLLIMLSAYGFSAFNIQLFGDDWRLVVNPNDMDYWVVSIGRWGQAFYRIIVFINTTFPPSATMILSLIILCVSAYIFLLLITHKRINNINVIYFCCLFVLCPVLLNVFNFKLIRVPFAAAVFVIMITVYFIRQTVRDQDINNRKQIYSALLGSFLIMTAISVRQSMLLVYIGLIQIIIISYLIDEKKKQYFKKYVITLIMMIFGALIFYIIFHQLIMNLLDVKPVDKQVYSMSKSLLSSLDQIPKNLVGLMNQINLYYFSETNYWPIITKVIFILGYIAFMILSVYSIFKRKKSFLYIGMFITVSLLMFATPFLLGFIRDNSLPGRYKETSLSSLALFYPVVYIFLCQLINNSRIIFLLHFIFGYIIIIWIFQINASALTQHYINQRDLITHNSIITRIETHENFKGYDGFTFVYIGRINDKPKNNNKIYNKKKSMLHCGIFNCQPGRVAKLFQISQYDMGAKYNIFHNSGNIPRLLSKIRKENLKVEVEEKTLANDMKSMKKWPHADSVKVYKNMALIKLGN